MGKPQGKTVGRQTIGHFGEHSGTFESFKIWSGQGGPTPEISGTGHWKGEMSKVGGTNRKQKSLLFGSSKQRTGTFEIF